MKEQINTLNDLQVENNNLKSDLEKEKQRSKNFKIIGKLYQCMYLHLMDRIIPSVIQNFKIVKLIRNGLDNLFIGVLDEYQNQSTNPDIRTQLFYDNKELNDSYTNIDQEFSSLPDVDEIIETSELDREKKEQLNQQVKQLKARKSQEERKARTKRLIEIGASVESVLGRPIEKDDLPNLIKFLEDQENRGRWFSKAMNKDSQNYNSNNDEQD